MDIGVLLKKIVSHDNYDDIEVYEWATDTHIIGPGNLKSIDAATMRPVSQWAIMDEEAYNKLVSDTWTDFSKLFESKDAKIRVFQTPF